MQEGNLQLQYLSNVSSDLGFERIASPEAIELWSTYRARCRNRLIEITAGGGRERCDLSADHLPGETEEESGNAAAEIAEAVAALLYRQ